MQASQYSGHMQIPTTGGMIDTEPQPSALDDFSYEIDVLEKDIAALADLLLPVLTQYADDSAQTNVPRPEPSSHLRGRIERLRDVRGQLSVLIGRIDL